MTAARADAVRWGALAIGVVLFAAALYYINVSMAVGTIRRLGLALPLALAASGLWHLARTWAWAWCFPQPRRVGFLRLVRVRLAAEAFSYLTLRGIAGEPLKVVLLNDRIDAREAAAAVALERLAYLVGTTIIVGIGSVIAILFLPLTRIWFRVFRAFAIGAAMIALLTGVVISGRGAYVQAVFARWDRRFGTSVATGRISRFVSAVERQMLDLVRGNPVRLMVLLAATIASYALMALEAWLILQASGTPVSAVGALTVETFSRVASFASAFIPANLGALEASSLAAVAAAGIAGGGAAVALARRIRGLFWAGVGLAIYPRGAQRPVVVGFDVDRAMPAQASGPVLLYVMRDPRVTVSPHVRIAGLPLSERILRSAFRAGYSQVIVWTGVASAREDRAFERMARQFAPRVTLARTAGEWRSAVDALDAGASVTAVGAGTLVSPALLADAATCAASRGAARDVAAGEGWPISGVLRVAAADGARITALASALRSRAGVDERPAGADVSHGRARLAVRILDAADVPHAELTLRRSSYKDTDAKVARFNRKISLPISVALIRTPLTANQLSVILVAVGLYSAWLFSIGHYGAGVLAGFLSLAASILDGCDGEIARLKYQESTLGCWIETFGDYSYYIAIFVGLTVGAVHQTGFELFYWVGIAALAGALLTFALLIYLRARITNGQPNRLHAVARARFKAEPTFWSRIIWRVSFVATRAAMPYGIMAFALLNILPGIMILAAIGANVYWMSIVLKLRDLLREEETVAA
ncbi:MAG TPA: lysylphosphatidylglycerol synthase domain-containing protein [Vicinamibacterales bacterium]|nr:lysylphosphatidylglycerol synthase domain-containing protein [Vicinamibacterales bacterium]